MQPVDCARVGLAHANVDAETIVERLGELVGRAVVGGDDVEARCRADGLAGRQGELGRLGALEDREEHRHHVGVGVADLVQDQALALSHGPDHRAVVPVGLAPGPDEEVSPHLGRRGLVRQRDAAHAVLDPAHVERAVGLARSGRAEIRQFRVASRSRESRFSSSTHSGS